MDFVSDVSHEFKTPINAIEGYTMLLQGEELSPDQEEYVEKILFNTQRLSVLVGNILLLSKLEDVYKRQEGGCMDEKILAYRSELQKRSENTPFWTKTILTVEEAAAYTLSLIHIYRAGQILLLAG